MRAESSDKLGLDRDLLQRIARRDTAAVGELYDRHARLLYGVICRIVRDDAEAEDVLQEVFLRVWERAETYDAALGAPTAWLVRIARNRAIDRVRARAARPPLQEGDQALATLAADDVRPPSPEGSAVAVEERQAITQALARLSPEQRILIEHAFFLGYTQSELAGRFQLPLGTVKTRIRTGMLALRDQLQGAV